MRVRYCPTCKKAGLKRDGPDGKGHDGLTDNERWVKRQAQGTNSYSLQAEQERWSWRYCLRCKEWVKPDLSHNFDQHKAGGMRYDAYQCPRCGSKKVVQHDGLLYCDVCALEETVIDYPVSRTWNDHYTNEYGKLADPTRSPRR